jgi:glycosyltransferase involved in cell wall biosynthesis
MRAPDLEAAGIPLEIFPMRSFASLDPLRAGLALRRYLKRHRIEVVHTFDVPSNAFAIPWARAAGVPRVFSSQRAHRNLTPKSLLLLQALGDRLAHGIVVNCQSVREELIRGYSIPPSRIHVVYNGIDTGVFTPAGPRASLPFPPDAIVVGTICALRPEKDLATLRRGRE